MNDNFPKLKIIPINKLILHEKEEPKRVEKLIKRIKTDGYFKNPVIAATPDVPTLDFNLDPNFLVLDGVHRVKALERLGCRDIVAQVVNYFAQSIKVYTWSHLLLGCSQKKLLEKIQQTGEFNLIKTNEKEARELLRRKKIVGYLLFKDGEIFLLNKFSFRNFSNSETNKSNQDFKERTEKLFKLMSIFGKVSELARVLKNDIPSLFKSRKDAIAALVIPNYTKKEILKVAQEGKVLPAGVTRHIIPNRVLGLDIDLAMLKNKLSLSLKNKLLEKFINKRIKDKRIRFYSESVFVFDE